MNGIDSSNISVNNDNINQLPTKKGFSFGFKWKMVKNSSKTPPNAHYTTDYSYPSGNEEEPTMPLTFRKIKHIKTEFSSHSQSSDGSPHPSYIAQFEANQKENSSFKAVFRTTPNLQKSSNEWPIFRSPSQQELDPPRLSLDLSQRNLLISRESKQNEEINEDCSSLENPLLLTDEKLKAYLFSFFTNNWDTYNRELLHVKQLLEQVLASNQTFSLIQTLKDHVVSGDLKLDNEKKKISITTLELICYVLDKGEEKAKDVALAHGFFESPDNFLLGIYESFPLLQEEEKKLILILIFNVISIVGVNNISQSTIDETNKLIKNIKIGIVKNLAEIKRETFAEFQISTLQISTLLNNKDSESTAVKELEKVLSNKQVLKSLKSFSEFLSTIASNFYSPEQINEVALDFKAMDQLFFKFTSKEIYKPLAKDTIHIKSHRLFSDAIAGLITIFILKGKTKGARVMRWQFFIDLAKQLKDMGSFLSSSFILAGFNNASISRLNQTWELVSEEHKNKRMELDTFFDNRHNYNNYRTYLMNCPSKDLIPLHNIYTRDLTFIRDGNETHLNGRLNFEKLELFATAQKHMYNCYQQLSPECTYSFDIPWHLLRLIPLFLNPLQLEKWQQASYKQSKKMER